MARNKGSNYGCYLSAPMGFMLGFLAILAVVGVGLIVHLKENHVCEREPTTYLFSTVHRQQPQKERDSEKYKEGETETGQKEANTVQRDGERDRPKSCVEAKRSSDESGVVTIYPENDHSPLQVYCDQDTDGGGWLVIIRRKDGETNFTRGWADYQRGFGDHNGDFWISLDALHMLTSRQSYDLRVDLMKFDGTRGYATYSNFSVGDSKGNYRLRYGRFTGGNAGNSLSYNNGVQFSTWDADHDTNRNNCAYDKKGGWWYRSCTYCNLNALLKDSRRYGEDGVWWNTFDVFYSLMFAEMKIRQA